MRLFVLASIATWTIAATAAQNYTIDTVDGQKVQVSEQALISTFALYYKSTVTNQQVVNGDGSVTVVNPRANNLPTGGYFSTATPKGACKFLKLGQNLGYDYAYFSGDLNNSQIYGQVYNINDDGTVKSTTREYDFMTTLTCKAK